MISKNIQMHLEALGIREKNSGVSTGLTWLGEPSLCLASHSPVDGQIISGTSMASMEDYQSITTKAGEGFQAWRKFPAPHRGEIVRKIGNQLREYKNSLGALVSIETGKSLQEGLGEVQEMIDIADFAVGLSRQLYGLTMHSERPNHRMYEQWHPLGRVGVITAFNFPVAVWAWNAMIAAVCGNTSVWKPSEKSPLTAVACFKVIQPVLKDNQAPEGVFNLLIGDAKAIGEPMVADSRYTLISATGSTKMGKKVAQVVASRLGKSILELGGNNAIIVTDKANLQIAIPGITFGAIGTCGQRCTSTRRIIIHPDIYDKVKQALVKAYCSVKIGNPLDEKNHVGPLIDKQAVSAMQQALEKIKAQGGKILTGGEVLEGPKYASGCYVAPCVAEVDANMDIVKEETFAPILYIMKYDGSMENAIHIQNDVPQGLSSAIFSKDLQQVEEFLSMTGSDCGLANANIGTSGAEIGGAFGGEKDTGGGRESGSDAWKGYMRRQTSTINYGSTLPLAQGIKFDL